MPDDVEGGPDDHDGDDEDRAVLKRGRFLAATTDDLSDAEAQTLAWRAAGYSVSGIAAKLDSTEGTVRKRLDKIAVRFGPAAVETKPADDREDATLSPVTPDELLDYPSETRAWWRSLADRHLEVAPEWVGDPETDPTGDGRRGHGGRGDGQGGAGQ